MRMVFGIHSLDSQGGMASYVLTVAEHLQRAGHEIGVHAAEGSGGALEKRLENAGIRALAGPDSLPREIDVFLVQDQPSAFELLALRPDVPQVFFYHGALFDINLSPQLPEVTRLFVRLGERSPGRADALAVKPPTLRLGQPIDLQRFAPAIPLGERPRSAVSISNYLIGERRETLIEACRRAGIELRLFGVHEQEATDDPAREMRAADIVFGKGRVAMEAMACGRAVYVFDMFGCDGWVTRENFDALLSTGFAGSFSDQTADAARIAGDLAAYDRAMGEVNRDLANNNLSATKYAGALVAAIEEALGADLAPPANDQASELERLARVSWGHESKAFGLRNELAALAAASDARLRESQRESAALNARLAEIVESRRWRLLNALLAPLDRLRRRR